MACRRFGDLSQVYPLARGVAPLMVTGVSIAACTLVGIGCMRLS